MTVFVPTIVSIDGTALSTYGFVAEQVPNARGMVTRDLLTVAVAGQPGAVVTETNPQVAVRDFTIVGTILSTSASAALSAYRNIQALCADGEHTIVLIDDTSRRIRARRISCTYTSVEVPLGGSALRIEIAWRAIDPYWEDVSATTVSLSTSPAACATGTAPCYLTLTIDQSCTITYKNSAGTTRATFVLTGVSGAQTAVIDTLTRTLTHSVSGITPSLRTSGTYFVLDPRDGTYASSSWPTITLSSGTGSVSYRKAWDG